MSSSERIYFAVDRTEGEHVVLIGDGGRQYEVLRSSLPSPVQEGSVLSVGLTESGEPRWAEAQLAPEERERRLKRAADVLKRLGQADSGGDIVL